eukprot:3155474-Amphidinium_carterae.1
MLRALTQAHGLCRRSARAAEWAYPGTAHPGRYAAAICNGRGMRSVELHAKVLTESNIFELHPRLQLNGLLWDRVVAANRCHYAYSIGFGTYFRKLSSALWAISYVIQFARTVHCKFSFVDSDASPQEISFTVSDSLEHSFTRSLRETNL